MTATTVSVMIVQRAYCQSAEISDGNDLVIAPHQHPVTVVASPMAGWTEKSTTANQAKCVNMMCEKHQIDLPPDQVTGHLQIRFPELFAETWFYVNGFLVAHRT